MHISESPNFRSRILHPAFALLLALPLLGGCNGSDGKDGAIGDTGPSGLPLLVETQAMTTDTCWNAARLSFGYDSSGDGVIDDVAVEETVCREATAEQTLTGQTILYYQDSGTAPEFRDALLELATDGDFTVLVAANSGEVETLLTEEAIDVLFYMIQSNQITEAAADVVADWVNTGGRLIYTTWSDEDTVVPTALGADFTGSTNLTTVAMDDPHLAWHLPDLVTVQHGSYNIYSRGLIAEGDGISVCTWENDDSCGIVANDGRTLMLGFLYPAFDETYYERLAINAIAYVLKGTEQ